MINHKLAIMSSLSYCSAYEICSRKYGSDRDGGCVSWTAWLPVVVWSAPQQHLTHNTVFVRASPPPRGSVGKCTVLVALGQWLLLDEKKRLLCTPYINRCFSSWKLPGQKKSLRFCFHFVLKLPSTWRMPSPPCLMHRPREIGSCWDLEVEVPPW